MTDVTFVKGETATSDRVWVTMPDGQAARVAVHVIHDLPHLVTDAALDGLAAQTWPEHRVAKTATNAVTNRWGDGPALPPGGVLRLEWPLPARCT
jgi:hypothetical protein